MVPVIYTTYGMAMGHRSGGTGRIRWLAAAGAERRPKPSAQIGVIRVCLWLGTVFARMRLRHRDPIAERQMQCDKCLGPSQQPLRLRDESAVPLFAAPLLELADIAPLASTR